MDKKLIQNSLNNVEIAGLKALFNEFYTDYLIQQGQLIEGEKANYGFFYCENSLYSEDVANGTPIYFEGYQISSLAKRENGDLTYMVLEDNKENEFLCEFNPNNGQWYILETELSGKTF